MISFCVEVYNTCCVTALVFKKLQVQKSLSSDGQSSTATMGICDLSENFIHCNNNIDLSFEGLFELWLTCIHFLYRACNVVANAPPQNR